MEDKLQSGSLASTDVLLTREKQREADRYTSISPVLLAMSHCTPGGRDGWTLMMFVNPDLDFKITRPMPKSITFKKLAEK